MATSIFVMVSIPSVQYSTIAPCRPSLAEFLLWNPRSFSD